MSSAVYLSPWCINFTRFLAVVLSERIVFVSGVLAMVKPVELEPQPSQRSHLNGVGEIGASSIL